MRNDLIALNSVENQNSDTLVLPGFEALDANRLSGKTKAPIDAEPDLLKQLPSHVLCDFQKILESLFDLQEYQNTQIIGVTSSHAGEGTSTIVSVLSLLAAVQPVRETNQHKLAARNDWQTKTGARQQSQNVLLIDTQLKHPSLHLMFGVNNNPGLYDYLDTKENIAASLRHVSNSRLKILPAGLRARVSSFQIYSDIFITLLDRLKNYVVLIFLDIPPILDYAEGITLCKFCDGVILNIKSESTRLESIFEAKNLLKKTGVHILGTILNNRKLYVPRWLYKHL